MSGLTPTLFDFITKPDSPSSVAEKRDTAKRLLQKLTMSKGTVCHAMNNFVGVLKYFTEGPLEALACFKQVLKDDPKNLNSLQNCKRVYRELLKDADVEKYDRELTTLLDSPEKPLLVARFHAELGFALSFDFTSDNDSEVHEYDLLLKAVAYYERALKDPRVFSLDESCQWCYFGAKAHHRCYDRFIKTHGVYSTEFTDGERDKLLIRSLELCRYVIRNCRDAFYTGQTWCLLGMFLFKLPSGAQLEGELTHLNTLSGHLSQCSFFNRIKHPDDCFETAHALLPDDAKIMCRHARLYMTAQFCDFQEAFILLEQSIQLDSSVINWLAFVSRAQLRKKIYIQQVTHYKRNSYPQTGTRPGAHSFLPDKELLEQAKNDYEYVLSQLPLVTNMVDLAEVCHLLGKDSFGHPAAAADQGLLDKALIYFKTVVESVKARKYPTLHVKRGNCLRDCGEIRSAIDSYKAALECSDVLRTDALGSLLKLLLDKCRSEGDSKRSVNSIVFWIDFAFRKCPKGCLSSLEFHFQKYTREMFSVCKQIDTTKQHVALLQSLLPLLIKALENVWERGRRTELVEEHLQEAKLMLPKLQSDKEECTGEKARNTRNKKYDFVVLYAGEDREWVYSMVPELEKLYDFRGFFSHRDIGLGENILKRTMEAVTESVCIIFIISSAFMKEIKGSHFHPGTKDTVIPATGDSIMPIVLDMVVEAKCQHIGLTRLAGCNILPQIPRLKVIGFQDWEDLVPLLLNLGVDNNSESQQPTG